MDSRLIEGREYYACGVCGLIYNEPATARECEEWCARGQG